MGGLLSTEHPDAIIGVSSPTILLGCVAYCDQVGSIWEGIRQYFRGAGVDFDFVLFTNYDRQVEALLGGFIDIAWNGPVAHIRTKRRTGEASLSLGMRDVDCNFVSHIVVRKSAGIQSVADLAGKRLAAGTRDSPQAAIVPMQFLKSEGVPLESLEVTFFDRDYGKHGDTAVGEIEVMAALSKGAADFGFVSDLMWQRALQKGDVNKAGTGEELVVLEAAKVPAFDHCQFDALPTLTEQKRNDFTEKLFAMDFNNEVHRKVMQLEGIKEQWNRPRQEGYEVVRHALEDEPVQPFPPPLFEANRHPFKSLTVA